ncbi:prisilkin-39-like isoform X16 [Mizuhopecten yessoensis]|uniref:prisilkin-39-like isoform X15 n=1 Tax=Mizuhopecten yessoensis TaxID=6573 RepID=UPI000B45997F|nr:prisilkin-39-like isoform X15 [Mizuhopecten yessoensis]XP_021363967.1 prisilkin-39-like isoform X16 [Mizuhopecten yessoensis]
MKVAILLLVCVSSVLSTYAPIQTSVGYSAPVYGGHMQGNTAMYAQAPTYAFNQGATSVGSGMPGFVAQISGQGASSSGRYNGGYSYGNAYNAGPVSYSAMPATSYTSGINAGSVYSAMPTTSYTNGFNAGGVYPGVQASYSSVMPTYSSVMPTYSAMPTVYNVGNTYPTMPTYSSVPSMGYSMGGSYSSAPSMYAGGNAVMGGGASIGGFGQAVGPLELVGAGAGGGIANAGYQAMNIGGLSSGGSFASPFPQYSTGAAFGTGMMNSGFFNNGGAY